MSRLVRHRWPLFLVLVLIIIQIGWAAGPTEDAANRQRRLGGEPNDALIEQIRVEILEGVEPYLLQGPWQRERMKFYLAVLSFCIGGLFIVMLLVSIVRGYRMSRVRGGVGRRGEKTPFVDAWAEHRLPDQMEGPES